VVKRRTARDRLTHAVRATYQWCRRHRHLQVRQQHPILCAKLRGHNQYYGINGNWDALDRFRRAVKRAWKKWLGRRSQQSLNWEAFERLHTRYPLPRPVIRHHRV